MILSNVPLTESSTMGKSPMDFSDSLWCT